MAKESGAMSERPAKLIVASIGDLHVRDDRTHSFRELFGEISQKANAKTVG